jgi:adenylylsulfate kinase
LSQVGVRRTIGDWTPGAVPGAGGLTSTITVRGSSAGLIPSLGIGSSYGLGLGIPGSTLRSALLITGTVGAGKTSVAEMVGHLLSEAGVPNAVIDLDWLRRSWPSSAGDRFNLAMEYGTCDRWPATTSTPALSGSFSPGSSRPTSTGTVTRTHSVCRLRVDPPVVRARLARRHEGEGAALQWHLDRSEELDTVLEAAGIEDFSVRASDLSISLAAAAVIRGVGWEGHRQSP